MSGAEDCVTPSVDTVPSAFDRFVDVASRTMPAELEAREALVSLGQVVVPKLAKAARGHSEPHVRRSCYELLMQSFADDERTANALIRHGMVDENPGIRYYSAASLGELRAQQAEPALRAGSKRRTKTDPIRFTLAVAWPDSARPTFCRYLSTLLGRCVCVARPRQRRVEGTEWQKP